VTIPVPVIEEIAFADAIPSWETTPVMEMVTVDAAVDEPFEITVPMVDTDITT
jgi:hypothetical protein